MIEPHTERYKETNQDSTSSSMKHLHVTRPEELISWLEKDNPEHTVLALCVNWNGSDVLGPTVGSLLDSDFPRLQVIVVDNASTDDSLEEVPGPVAIWRLERNAGYGGAINRVLDTLLKVQKQMGAQLPDYFLLLNNDLEIEAGAVRHLMEAAREKGPGVYGPKVLSFAEPSRLDAAWGRLTWSHVLTRFYGKGAPASEHQWNRSRQVELLLGCCLLVHRQVFETVGLFDERFFMYHEEIDLLYRAGHADFPVYYCPKAEVRHRGAFSIRSQPLQKVCWLRENSVRFLRKYRPGPLRWAYFLTTLTGSFAFNLLAFRWSRVDAIYRGVRKGFED